MIDYTKIGKEYDRIHSHFDDLEDKGISVPQRAALLPIAVGDGLPLVVRCFLIYRALQREGVVVESLYNTQEGYTWVDYHDPYELPFVGRRITLSDGEKVLLKEIAGIKPEGFFHPNLRDIVEKYLIQEGVLSSSGQIATLI